MHFEALGVCSPRYERESIVVLGAKLNWWSGLLLPEEAQKA